MTQVQQLCAHPSVRAGAFDGQIPPRMWLRHLLEDAPAGSLWAVRAPAEHDLLGVVGVHAQAQPHTPHIVAIFDPACWGLGYAQEAYACFWTWMKSNLAVEHVHALLRPEQTRAMALCESMDMRLMGILHPERDPRIHYKSM